MTHLRLIAICVLFAGCEADVAAPDLGGRPAGGKTDRPTLGGICLNEDGLFEELGLEDGTDLGFRYVFDEDDGVGRCVDDDGNEGLNPACLGECGDLSGRTMTGWDIQWWWMYGIDFSYAKLNGTKFRNAKLIGAKFRNANLTGTDFTTSDVEYADFRNANLSSAFMGFAYMGRADLRGAKCTGTWWSNTKLFEADLRGAKMGSPLGFQYMHACGLTETASCALGARYSDTTVLPFHPDKVGYFGLIKQADDPPPGGDTYALHLGDTNDCLGAGAEEGSAAAVVACDLSDGQHWKFAPSEGGSFRLVNDETALCLEVDGGSPDVGAAIVVAPCTGGDRQRWLLDLVGDDVMLVNKRSNHCIEVAPAGEVAQQVCDSGAQQVWKRLLRL